MSDCERDCWFWGFWSWVFLGCLEFYRFEISWNFFQLALFLSGFCVTYKMGERRFKLKFPLRTFHEFIFMYCSYFMFQPKVDLYFIFFLLWFQDHFSHNPGSRVLILYFLTLFSDFGIGLYFTYLHSILIWWIWDRFLNSIFKFHCLQSLLLFCLSCLLYFDFQDNFSHDPECRVLILQLDFVKIVWYFLHQFWFPGLFFTWSWMQSLKLALIYFE